MSKEINHYKIGAGRAFAKKNRNHFFDWCQAEGVDPTAVNRKVFRRYGGYLLRQGLIKGPKVVKVEPAKVVPCTMPLLKVSAPSTAMKPKAGSLSTPATRPMIDMSVACPATGFIKSSCGCPRCKNARIKNARVR